MGLAPFPMRFEETRIGVKRERLAEDDAVLPVRAIVLQQSLIAIRRKSAGLLMFRTSNDQLEVLLVHPGAALWAKKDKGA